MAAGFGIGSAPGRLSIEARAFTYLAGKARQYGGPAERAYARAPCTRFLKLYGERGFEPL